jgi:hypothetical protein
MPHEYSLLFQLLLNLDRIRKAYSDEYEFFVRPFNHKQGNKRIEENIYTVSTKIDQQAE